MAVEEIDFYSKTSLSSYNLTENMRYQLNMLDRLDVFTRKHSENVANITCRLCEYLKCRTSFTVYCTICAYLHDIGKFFIPEEILQKPSKLTDEEYEIIKTHTTLGYKMCMKDPELRPYANGALYHHEALNGTGYPNGVSGKDIPLEGQIIRVADEYDAIVSKRQYKSHVGISDTLKIIVEESMAPQTAALDKVYKDSKLGKVNPKIVKALFKVVIDDVEYEISTLYEYLVFLERNIKRLETMDGYRQKMESSAKDKDKAYYLEGIKSLLAKNETVNNFSTVLEDYKKAYSYRKAVVDKLYEEIKVIKKLKL